MAARAAPGGRTGAARAARATARGRAARAARATTARATSTSMGRARARTREDARGGARRDAGARWDDARSAMDARGATRARAIRDAASAGGESSSGKTPSEGTGNECEGFGDPNASGFSFSAASSAGGEPLSSDEGARADAARRLTRLESLTQLRELYGTVVECEKSLANDFFVVHADADGNESNKLFDGKPLSAFAVPSAELEEAMSALEEMVEVMSKLEVEQEKLRAAPAAMAGRWDSLFDDPDAARAELENKFADLGARVEARCREMAAYLPYGSRAEAERALEQAEDALEAAEEDQGETQVGARLRPLGRRVGRFTSRRVRSAEGVLGEGLEQLKASPRESIKSAAQYSRGVWARINGLNIGDSGVVEVLKAYPVPRVPREKREARVLRLTIEVQDRDKALTEAQRARDAIMAQGRNSALSRVALGDKIRDSDEKVSTLRRVFAVRTLQMEMERIMLALEEEVAAPPDTLSRGEMKDMRLMVAEFGVMDLSLRRLISLVDRQQSQLIDDEALSKLAMEIPDMKSRLAISDEPNVAMSLDMMRERMSLTVNESVETIREAGTFLVRGVRLLGSDIGTSVRLFLRAAFGTTLRPREVQVLRRTFLDVFTFVPFMIILITPITPVGHVLVFGFIQKYFPQLFPSQFTTRRQELMQKYEELKDQLAMAEEQADAANESEALRRAVAAVSSVRGIISGAVSDAADALAGGVDEEAQSKLEQQRVNALRAELDETEIRLNETSDDDDEEPKTASAKKSD
jgi:hypothetical protein